jgi:hypothetical protein
MPLVEHDDVIETLLAKSPNYPFRDSIRQRRPVGVRTSAMPASASLFPKSSPYTLSRSWIRYRGCRPQAVASIACLQIHAAVGLAVKHLDRVG